MDSGRGAPPSIEHDADDEPDTFPCYRHSDRETALQCLQCDRPICVDCAVHGAVGIKCPECARTPRAARGAVPVARVARAAVAAAVTALVLGGLLTIAAPRFFLVILGYLVGLAVGEAARRGSGGFRDPVIARIAAAAAFVGVLALPAAAAVASGTVTAYFAFVVLAALLAAFGAASRA